MELLTKAAVTTQARFVIVDMLEHILPEVDLNDYGETCQALDKFAKIAKATKTFFLFLHHDNRSGHFLGSQGILGTVDVALQLKKTGIKRRLQSVKVRIGKPLPPSFVSLDGSGRLEETDAGASKIIDVLLPFPGATSKEISGEAKMSNGKVLAELDIMMAAGRVGTHKEGRKKLYYRITDSESGTKENPTS